MVVGSFDAWLNSSRIMNYEFQRSLETSGWSALHTTTKTIAAPCAAGSTSIKLENPKIHLAKPAQQLSLLTVELREKQAKMQPRDMDTSQAPRSGGSGSLLPRAMSESEQQLGFAIADLTTCNALSSPLDRGGLGASCDLGRGDRHTGCSGLHGTSASTASETENNGCIMPLTPHRHHAGTEASVTITNGWSVTAATLAVQNELFPSAAGAGGGGGSCEPASAAIQVKAASGISAMGSRTSEKRNTYDKTVRGGHPRAASGWRCSGSSSSGEDFVAAGCSSLPGPWAAPFGFTTATGQSGLTSQPLQQLQLQMKQGSREPQLLSDMLRNALYRN